MIFATSKLNHVWNSCGENCLILRPIQNLMSFEISNGYVKLYHSDLKIYIKTSKINIINTTALT